MDELIPAGTRLHDQYRIEDPIRRGRHDVLYRAQDLRDHRLVAIKDVFDKSTQGAQYTRVVAQLRDEYRTLSSLIHPGLPQVYTLLEEGDHWFLVMEFLRGHTLETLVEEAGGPLPEATVRPWIGQLLDVLEFLHQQRPPIIYRDLRPVTVLVTVEGQVKLCDFSIAKMLDPAKKSRTLFRSVGSPEYSPPQSFGLTRSDPPMDIYSLGATLYFLLSGAPPPLSAARSIHHTPLDSLQGINPAVSEGLDKAIRKMMELRPEERPADVPAVRALLADVGVSLSADVSVEVQKLSVPAVVEAPTVPQAGFPGDGEAKASPERLDREAQLPTSPVETQPAPPVPESSVPDVESRMPVMPQPVSATPAVPRPVAPTAPAPVEPMSGVLWFLLALFGVGVCVVAFVMHSYMGPH